ncbi:hypothetical protein SERLA73DRAFT_63440 [Serpula lacrymans var. lacrymans S7.3]|uniref:AMP-dependent synthetase/ligase domain-containing protein n=1 Tax=Serpula lacrymans var. lacrymans (strain S7.3) TaxID=936435 RepID=F8QCH3_SERL3|nr:hypothetical protein SERLA73DRAFT_63440 [Serpula lacrymans var. lacrymans S7.3]
MSQSSEDHHFLSLLKPVLLDKREALIFRPYIGSCPGFQWGTVTFGEFDHHLAASAKHWGEALENSGFKSRDIIGVWLTGSKYEDLINILGICAAGYVPQLFSVAFTPHIIRDLVSRSGAKGLVYDSAFTSQVNSSSSSVPLFPSVPVGVLENNSHFGRTLGTLPSVVEKDTAFVVHSSGTTSGTPKIIPANHLWVKTFIQSKWASSLEQGTFEGQTVVNSIGSLAHVGSLCAFLGAAYCGSCTVQSSALDASTSELLGMISTCGLNRVALYATFLSTHIRAARTNPEVLHALKCMRQILHTGVALNREDEEWALHHALPLTTMYGTSETSPLLTSLLGNDPSDRLLRPVHGASGQLIPAIPSSEDGSRPAMFEMVVPSDAPDSPHSSFFSADGFYHTGDLFEEVEKGSFVFRGRSNDWIKTVRGFCDTKSMEDIVRKACGDLIKDVVVVGLNRPRPVLMVEISDKTLSGMERHEIAEEIIARLAPHNERLFTHERIDDPKRILVLEEGNLPRTKVW